PRRLSRPLRHGTRAKEVDRRSPTQDRVKMKAGVVPPRGPRSEHLGAGRSGLVSDSETAHRVGRRSRARGGSLPLSSIHAAERSSDLGAAAATTAAGGRSAYSFAVLVRLSVRLSCRRQ